MKQTVIKIIVVFFAFATGHAALAQELACKEMILDDSSTKAWSVPSELPSDAIAIPMTFSWKGRTLAWSLSFTPITFPEPGLFPTDSSIYTMGSDSPEPFENNLRVRVASAIGQNTGNPQLFLGSFEVSLGQFALIAGGGDLERGLEVIAENSGDPDLKAVRQFLDTQQPCHRRMTQALHATLRLPMTFFRHEEYHLAVRSLNLLCSETPGCAAMLQTIAGRKGQTAYFRLPYEHEWEFAARGAYSYVRGDFTAQDLQLQLPPLQSGQKLKAYAHFENSPPRLLPIGAKVRLHGFYDLFGNAQELMANPFTSEAGSGAVGGAMARGGSFRTVAKDMRSSKRTELSIYLKDEATGRYYPQFLPLTGMRLAIGIPVLSVFGRAELQDDFARTYVSVDDVGDAAGETPQGALDIGTLVSGETRLNDELGPGDPADIYAFTLDSFGTLVVTIKAGDKLVVSLLDGIGQEIAKTSLRANVVQQIEFPGIYPGRSYLLQFAPRVNGAAAIAYEVILKNETAADTGVEKAAASTLQYAEELRNAVVEYAAYVGGTDPSDFYPLRMVATAGGIRVGIDGNLVPLRIALLDRDGKVLREDMAAATGERQELLFTLPKGTSAFVHVTPAKKNSDTAYSISIAPAVVQDKTFGRTPGDAGEALPEKEYLGALGGDVKSLYLAFRLRRPSDVQAVLTKLATDVSLAILNSDGKELPNQKYRPGPRDKIFKRVLPAGRYLARISVPHNTNAATGFGFSFEVEARSSKDLDQREQALAEISALAEGQETHKVLIPTNMSARYFKYVPTWSGEHIFNLAFSTNQKLSLKAEAADGSKLGTSTDSDVFSGVRVNLQSGDPVFLYVMRRGLSLDMSRAELSVVALPPPLARVVQLDFSTPVSVMDSWLIYVKPDACGIAAVSIQGKSSTDYPVMYVEVVKEKNGWFRHGVFNFNAGTKNYDFYAIRKGQETKLDTYKDPGRHAFLLKSCSTDTTGCFDSGLAKAISESSQVKLVAGSSSFTFDMSGYKAALGLSILYCNSSTSYLLP